MNTKTMRLPPRRVLTPSGTANKRKEREDPFERPKAKPITPTTTKLLKPDKPILKPGSEPITSAITTSSGSGKGFEPLMSNHLLAGYLAHEYLTKGTLLGQPWAPCRAEGPIGDKRKGIDEEEEDDGGEEGEAAAAAPCRRAEVEEQKVRYAEVAGLFKGGGTHLPDVVNPTQLARFLHL